MAVQLAYQPYTPRQAFADFMADKKAAGRSTHTLHGYRLYLGRFVDYLGAHEIYDVKQIDRNVFRAFIRECQSQGLSNALLSHAGGSARTFIRWLVQEGELPDGTEERLRVPKQKLPEIKPFTEEQCKALLEATQHTEEPERNRAILLLLLDSAVRSCEVRRATDQDLDGNQLRVRGKGGKVRVVPVGDVTLRAIEAYRKVRPANSPRLFVNKLGRPMDRRNIYDIFVNLKKLSGIEGVRVSPHTCRHTAAVMWLKNGGNVFELQQLLGHYDLTMTRRYCFVSVEAVLSRHQQIGLAGRLHAD